MHSPGSQHVIVALAITAFACAVAPSLEAAVPEGNRVEEPKQLGQVLAALHVVEGSISSVKLLPEYSSSDGTVSEVQLGVWRVYCGDGVPEGGKFTALLGEGKPNLRHADAYNRNIPLLDQKDANHRTWLIEWDADQARYSGQPHVGSLLLDGSVIFLTDRRFLLPFLGHELGDEPARLEVAPKVAAALYSLAKTNDDVERVRLLEKQIRTGGAFVAVTDCWLLYNANGTPNRGKVAMELFLDPQVPIAARASLDELVRRSGWADLKSAPGRDKAFLDMAAAARTESDFFSLGVAMRRGAQCDLSIGECLEVTQVALRNEFFLRTCDEDAAANFVDFSESVESEVDRDKVFEFFTQRIGASADNRFELAAAAAIASSERRIRLTPEQVERLSKLRTTSRNDIVASRLDLAISKSKK